MRRRRFTQETFRHFLESETSGGLVLMGFAALGMIAANSALSGDYTKLFHTEILGLDLLHWINDGLMAVFFLLVGLEIKREMLEGQLDTWPRRALPLIAAFGGMLFPALFFMLVNAEHPENWRGWAIPTATDIAFALGVLALVGRGLPAGLKTFLLTLAILDDLGAILIIAVFYTEQLNLMYLGLSLIPLAGLTWLHQARAARVAPALLLGAILWVLVLKSGVHATLAGVVTAFFIPLHDRKGGSPLEDMEHGLEPYVGFLIVPLFAFANAGLSFQGMTLAAFGSSLTLGVGLGLVLGKFLGVLGVTWVMVRLGAAQLPETATWLHMAGIALLAGIGFTMSLFIGGLSFGEGEAMNAVRLGVLAASGLAAVAGFAVLWSARAQVSVQGGARSL
jgi:NhaA family Na+:H+ antiporter